VSEVTPEVVPFLEAAMARLLTLWFNIEEIACREESIVVFFEAAMFWDLMKLLLGNF